MEQFNELTAGLIRLHNEQTIAEHQREEARAERDTRRAYEQARRHVTEQTRQTESKLERQITVCSGDCPQGVRTWLSEVGLSIPRAEGNASIVRIASNTLSGALREEFERYLTQRGTEDHIARENEDC